MDATMMANTERGRCFSFGDYSNWLTVRGFIDLRVIEPIGFQRCFVATKPDQS